MPKIPHYKMGIIIRIKYIGLGNMLRTVAKMYKLYIYKYIANINI